MLQNDIADIAKAKLDLKDIDAINQVFLQHVAAHQAPDPLTSLNVVQDRIEIDCFGYSATAKSRPVRADNDRYYIEYVFIVPYAEKKIEVTRFYLSDCGEIVAMPSAQSSICDFKNPYISLHLCQRALSGTLKSVLFSPSEASS